MNGESINCIVRCAFKICYIYFLKCFLPSINLGLNINLFSPVDYDCMLCGQINHMKQLIISNPQPQTQCCENIKTDDSSKQTQICDGSEILSKNSNSTQSDDHSASIKEAARCEIKQTITSQLKKKYGDDICIEFNYADNDKKKEKMIYSLKIKQIGPRLPNPDNYSESDIYVNTKTKSFYVRSGEGFASFPLIKQSIVKCEKS